MNTETFIVRLLKKYGKAPSFPFDDWATDPVSFYALMNLWDDLFRVAAGSRAAGFSAVGDAIMDPESRIYEVMDSGAGIKVNVSHEKEGGTFYLYANEADYDFPFRVYLGFPTDLKSERLAACFDIIRDVLGDPPRSVEEADTMQELLGRRYRHVFGFPDYDPFAWLDRNDETDPDVEGP